MPTLPPSPTLADFQRYVKDVEGERGFTNETVLQQALLLGEEVGELFQAIRKITPGMTIDPNTPVGTPNEELADIFIYICSLANRLNVDLETAFRAKEEINKTRKWA